MHGAQYFPRMLGGLETVVAHYGNRVRQEHKVGFVKRPEVFEQVQKWVETAILRLIDEGQTRMAQTFCDTLAAATGQRPVALAPRVEEGHDDQDERGTTEQAGEQSLPVPAEALAAQGTVGEKEATRGHAIPIFPPKETRSRMSLRDIQTRAKAKRPARMERGAHPGHPHDAE